MDFHRIVACAAFVALLAFTPQPLFAAPIEELSFVERIDAQEAIEQVYQRHRLAAPAGIELGREVLERKVRTYLEQSAALEEIWGQPITAAALRRELERIARDTRYPDRLAEIYDALGSDPRLLLECFARPVLADRMARSFHSLDPTVEASWDEWLAEVRPRLHPERVAAVVTARESLPAPRGQGRSTLETTEATEACLANDTWNNQSLDDFPEGRLDPAAVWTGTEMIVWGGTIRSGARYDPLLDHWTILPRAGAPTATGPAVWTGSEMIVWAGGPEEVPGRYSPVTDAWQPVSLDGAPTAGYRQAAAWVGNRMVVWDAFAQQGGRYDPATDTWSPVSMLGAPSPRYFYGAVGAGNRLLIWGGSASESYAALNTGGQYDPATDVWTSTSTSGAPAGGEVSAVVWTGTRMIAWSSGGGGGMYDPVSNAWSAISTTGQPSARTEERAVWTGSQMIVWGGRSSSSGQTLNDGRRYDPASNSWVVMSSFGAPPPRKRHAAVWDGTRMIIWGGDDGLSLDSGGRYDPVANAWTPVSQGSAPKARAGHGMVWTGSEMLIWGGLGGERGGARYDPLTDSWTAVSGPAGTIRPYAFWTGHYLLVYGDNWGGNEGWRYDPAADWWLRITAAGAPPPWYDRPAATWAGTRMFVIGLRQPNADPVAAFYNPEADAWTPISLADAPWIPLRGAVVWTGARAILFGGSNGSDDAFSGEGAMFDPVAGTWTMLSQEGEPSPRVDHEAIWTGDRMLVWGGSNHSDPVPGGGLYDPLADRWTPIAQPEWLPLTHNHSLVWTGDRMIVWGGSKYNTTIAYSDPWAGSFDQDTGGLYDPATDAWTPIAAAGAPAPRSWHGAVWTGSEMIVWGGSMTRTGGRYALGQADDRDGDGVSFCTGDCDDADPAVHPGAAEICDGRDNDCDGVLLPAEGLDSDLDLAPACSDCDDANPARYPGALEFCDGIDNDCDGVANETDSDGDHRCATDCDDGDPATYPRAQEANDGVDNQCPGDPGFGLVDEVSGSPGFYYGNDTLCWPSQAGATLYEMLRASNGAMSASCVLATKTSSCFTDHANPASRAYYVYLMRSAAPNVGSWGFRSSGEERLGLCVPAPALSFQDTAGGDDVPAQALQQFFTGITVTSGDYLRFSLHGSGIDFDLCVARADFYRDKYLSLAPTSGVASSGSWEKWTRVGAGPWSGPVVAPFENWFGDDCVGAWSWCPEAGLAGRFPGIAPAEPGVCEAFENMTCSDGTWTLTVTVGVDRPSACGF